MDTSASLYRPTETKTANGATSRSYAIVGSAFLAAVWPTSTAVVKQFFRRDLVGDTLVVTDTDKNVKPQDKIVIGSTSYIVHSGNKFQNAATGGELVYVIEATEIKTGA